MATGLLSDLLRPEAVLLPLEASDCGSAVEALVGVLVPPDLRRGLAAAVLARERAGSTGIGNGVAIPHARSAALDAPRLAVGLAPRPVDFKSADGKPVSLIFLLAVPEADPKSHLKALAALSRVAMDKKFLSRLLKSPSPQDLYGLLAARPLA